MPALTITAVDFTTDQLTIPAHGLSTGDGAAAVRNVGGGLPAPLAAVTDYWIIRVDANTVKLATSSANALLGTAINLTTNGTGTQILEIGIPYRRARTLVPSTVDKAGAQVKSADINAMQDAFKALHALLTAQPQSTWTIGGETEIVTLPGSMWVDPNGTHTRLLGASGAQLGYTLAASANKLTMPVRVRVGDVITGWSVYMKKNTSNANTVSAQLWKCNDSVTGTETALGAGVSNNQNAPTFVALSEAGLSTNVIAGDQFFLVVTPGGGIAPAADFLSHASVTVTRALRQ